MAEGTDNPTPAGLNPKLAYTVADVARFLRASDKSVYALIRAGQLRARRIGMLRGWRVMGSAVYDFMSAPEEGL